MSTRLVLIFIGLLILPAHAFAHRLDEYLQAATIDVAKNGIGIELRLTPGVSVARQVISGIDANGDGLLSAAEQQSYAERVRQDLSLAVDGRAEPLRLVSSSFPGVEQLTAGTGDIDLRFAADAPGNASDHRLIFENRHESAIAVYLVNTLLPKDPTIRVIGQRRNYSQSSYKLDFAIASPVTSVDAQMNAGGHQQSRLAWTDWFSIVETYFWHGVHHILTGYDHLLFISALVLGASTLWDLIKVVTAFTIAHSVTLTLAALNLVHVPDAIVEPLISASIVFVAVQNIFWPEQSRGGIRLAVAFFFGLFHGLGFAGGLIEIMHQMPAGTILLAILGFSLGVEVGNQMVLLPLFGVLKAVRGPQTNGVVRPNLPRLTQQIASAAVSVAGVYYLYTALIGVA